MNRKYIYLAMCILLIIIQFSFAATVTYSTHGNSKSKTVTYSSEERRQQKQDLKDRRFNISGKKVTLRLYDKWLEKPDEYKLFEGLIKDQPDSQPSILHFENKAVSNNAAIIMFGQDQKDETVKEVLGNIIFGWLYKEGPDFDVEDGICTYNFEMVDAIGQKLPPSAVNIYVYHRDYSNAHRIYVNQADVSKEISLTIGGSFKDFFLSYEYPDESCSFQYDSASDDQRIIAEKDKWKPEDKNKVHVPLVPEGCQEFERRVCGTVVDKNGKPISGAYVKFSFVDYPGSTLLDRFLYGATVRTNDNGSFWMYVPNLDANHRPVLNPLDTKYRIDITVPNSFGLLSIYRIVACNDCNKIEMNKKGYFHRFVFEIEGKQVVDKGILNDIRITVDSNESSDSYSYHKFRYGICLPLGTYSGYAYIDTEKKVFMPVEVNETSPETIVLKIQQKPNDINVKGRLIDGVTGKPISGAFVIESLGRMIQGKYASFGQFSQQQWNDLHSIGKSFNVDKNFSSLVSHIDSNMKFVNECKFDVNSCPKEYFKLYPIGTFYSFTRGVRTNTDGSFEIPVTIARDNCWLFIFDENYLPINMVINIESSLGNQKQDRIDIPDIPLFPAAKIKAKILICENEGVDFEWIIDEVNAPPWTGIKKYNQNTDEIQTDNGLYDIYSNPAGLICLLLYDAFIKDTVCLYGIPIKIPHYNIPKDQSQFQTVGNKSTEDFHHENDSDLNQNNYKITFADMQRNSVFCKTEYLPLNQNVFVLVPAEVELKTLFHVNYSVDRDVKWQENIGKRNIKLKQGDMLDIGTVEIQIAPKVQVKLIDKTGQPAANLPVEHWFKDECCLTKYSDPNGIADFYSRYNMKTKFVIGNKSKEEKIYQEYPYAITNKADDGKQFTITVEDKVIDYYTTSKQ